MRLRLSLRTVLGAGGLMDTTVLSSARQDWQTPGWFCDLVRDIAPIALDPCASRTGQVHAWWNYYEPYAKGWGGGLETRWTIPADTLAFVNPEYGRAISKWTEKMAYEASRGVQVVALIPARVGTRYWERDIWPTVDAVCFWVGRIKFVDANTGLPADAGTFDASVLYWGRSPERFADVFGARGQIVLKGKHHEEIRNDTRRYVLAA